MSLTAMNHYCRLIGSNILIRWTFQKTVNHDKELMNWKIVKDRGRIARHGFVLRVMQF